MKVCNKCGIEKPISEFNTNKKWCRLCEREYHKIYYEKNKEKVKEKVSKYREENIDKVRETNKKYKQTHRQLLRDKAKRYYYDNRDTILEKHKDYMVDYNKEYYEKNKDDLLDKKREYQEKNKEQIKEYRKIYEKENREKIQSRHRKYLQVYTKERKENDALFKMTIQLRGLISGSFTRRGYTKKSNTYKIIGTDYKTFYNHMLKTFKDNYGYDWDGKEPVHIDHIIPLAIATTEQEIIDLCYYTNLQLLKTKDNLEKGDRLDWKIGGGEDEK